MDYRAESWDHHGGWIPHIGVFWLIGQRLFIIVRSCNQSISGLSNKGCVLAVNHGPSLSSTGPRQWGESAGKTSRLPGALSPSWQDRALSLSLAGDNRLIRSNLWNSVEVPTPRTTERSIAGSAARRPPILISLTCTLRSDQCLTALGRHSRRRKFPRLYARMNRDRRTRLATNRWHDSEFRAYFPSLIHCSAVPRPCRIAPLLRGQPSCS